MKKRRGRLKNVVLLCLTASAFVGIAMAVGLMGLGHFFRGFVLALVCLVWIMLFAIANDSSPIRL